MHAEFLDGAGDVFALNFIGTVDVGGKEGFIANVVDDAWDAAAGAVDFMEGKGGEFYVTVALGDGEAVVDVFAGLFEGEGFEVVMDEDALFELAEVLLVEDGLEFGLAHEDDLEEFFLIGFEVGEESNLFEDGE